MHCLSRMLFKLLSEHDRGRPEDGALANLPAVREPSTCSCSDKMGCVKQCPAQDNSLQGGLIYYSYWLLQCECRQGLTKYRTRLHRANDCAHPACAGLCTDQCDEQKAMQGLFCQGGTCLEAPSRCRACSYQLSAAWMPGCRPERPSKPLMQVVRPARQSVRVLAAVSPSVTVQSNSSLGATRGAAGAAAVSRWLTQGPPTWPATCAAS